jgi:hypothetical protein
MKILRITAHTPVGIFPFKNIEVEDDDISTLEQYDNAIKKAARGEGSVLSFGELAAYSKTHIAKDTIINSVFEIEISEEESEISGQTENLEGNRRKCLIRNMANDRPTEPIRDITGIDQEAKDEPLPSESPAGLKELIISVVTSGNTINSDRMLVNEEELMKYEQLLGRASAGCLDKMYLKMGASGSKMFLTKKTIENSIFLMTINDNSQYMR